MFLLEIFLEIFERIQEFESKDPRKGLSKSFNILSKPKMFKLDDFPWIRY